VAHGIFVMRYWVLSQKINQIVEQKVDKYLSLKSWILNITLYSLILTTITLNVLIVIDKQVHKTALFNLLLSLPPIIIVAVLFWSLYTLRNYRGTEYSVDKWQILL
jgi:uncharacterized membrane protein